MSTLKSVLALALRPKSLDELIGADEFVKRIRKRFTSKRIPKALMLVGQTGSGKTTTARIIGRALQCTHGKIFGAWCARCWHRRHDFDITEINSAEIRGVDDVESAVGSYVNYPLPGSLYRVYILDEAHRMSGHSQDLLLKHTEECPDTTIFIFNTTREDMIIRTLRSRCHTYPLPGMDFDSMKKMVKRAIRKADSDYDSSELIEKLMEKDVTSPRLILKAVELYLDGSSPDEASEVEATSKILHKRLCRQAVSGDWESVAHQLKKINPEDVHAVQGAVCKYLLGILITEKDFSTKCDVCAKSITRLSNINGSDNVQMSALGAILYDVCHFFKKYSR